MQKENKAKLLTDEAIFKSIFYKTFYSSALAIIFGCIGQIIGNIVVGNSLGEEKLAVMSLIQPVYYIFATIGNLAGIGGSAVCAKYIGNRDTDKCKKAFTATYIFTFGLCVFFTVIVMAFLPNIVMLLNTPDDLYTDVRNYCAIMSIGGFFTAGVYLSFNFLRLDGKALATTFTFVIMAVVNILLDFVLAFMGVSGIGIATIAGSAAATLFGLVMIWKGSNTLGFIKISVKEFFAHTKDIVRIGSPGATENASILIKSYLFVQIITSLVGAAVLSQLSVINSINSFSLAITVGSAGALVPIIGVFSSERDTQSIRKTVKTAFILAGSILLFFMVIIDVFAEQISGLFGITSGVDEMVSAIRLFSVSLPLALVSNILIYLHLANGHTVIANVMTALKYLFFAVGFAFAMMKWLGSDGLWLSFVACEIGTIAVAAVLHLASCLRNRDLSPFMLLNTSFEKKGVSIALITSDDDQSISETVEKLSVFCENNELPKKRSMIITLSMDEMLHMAAEHSTRNSDTHTISIRVLFYQDILILRLRYVGELFNPIEYYQTKKTDATDIDAMLELADCLGIKMVTDTCDVVDYRTTFGINNLTIIT